MCDLSETTDEDEDERICSTPLMVHKLGRYAAEIQHDLYQKATAAEVDLNGLLYNIQHKIMPEVSGCTREFQTLWAEYKEQERDLLLRQASELELIAETWRTGQARVARHGVHTAGLSGRQALALPSRVPPALPARPAKEAKVAKGAEVDAGFKAAEVLSALDQGGTEDTVRACVHVCVRSFNARACAHPVFMHAHAHMLQEQAADKEAFKMLQTMGMVALFTGLPAECYVQLRRHFGQNVCQVAPCLHPCTTHTHTQLVRNL